MVQERALTMIARDVALGSAIGNMELAPAMAATEQPGQQSFAAPHGAAARPTLSVGVVADQALIPLERVPADIPLMMVTDQNLPVRPLNAKASNDALAAVLDSHLAGRAAERIGARVDGVRQDVMDGVVDRRLPLQAPIVRTMADGGKRDPLLAKPDMDLPHALQLGEFVEDQGEPLAHAQVRILLDSVGPAAYVAHGDRREQFPAAGLLLERLVGALAQDRQLHLAHGPFHAEEKAVVGEARIVDAVFVGDQRPDEAAELQQRVPIAPIAGQTRSLDRHHGSDAALADRRQELLEPRTGDAGAGTAEIVVDDADGGPAELPGALDEPILSAAALDVVEDLVGRRLADIDDRLAGEMVSSDPAHGAPPSGYLSTPRSTAPPSGALEDSPRSPDDVGSESAADWAALRTGPAGGDGSGAWSAPPVRGESPCPKPRTASRWARRSRRRTTQSRGAGRIAHPAASGRIIHVGISVSVPSISRIVMCSTPPWTTRRPVEATVIPARGWNA